MKHFTDSHLTNVESFILFRQYGEAKRFRFYGSLNGATLRLVSMCGQVPVLAKSCRDMGGFLPAGTWDIETPIHEPINQLEYE